MKKIIILTFSFLLLGCAATYHRLYELTPDKFQKSSTDTLFNESFDNVLDSTLSALSDFPIISVNKDIGLIVTDWKVTQQAPFIFVMNSEQYGKGIFKSDIGGSYSQKRERLNVRIKPEPEGTRVSINTTVEVYFDNTMAAIALSPLAGRRLDTIKEWRPAESDSITESKILGIIENNLKNTQIKPTSSDPR